MRNVFIGILTLACSVCATSALAEGSTKVDGYTIHHNAFTTDFLTPEISHAYRIPRSRNRAMLNVSIIREEADSTGVPVSGWVQAFTINYLGQQRPILLREIREGDAIYYIGDFLVQHGERLNFNIEVRPEGSDQAYTAQMSQDFYTRY